MYVEEKNRSWCTSSRDNDQRAITIECASDTKEPYTMHEVVYERLIELCVDICKRNGKTKLLWFSDKTKTLNYEPKSNEMVLTVHRWFANKACPGDWLYNRLGEVAAEVTKRLTTSTKEKKATESAKSFDESLAGKYKTTIDLYIRNGAGTSKAIMVTIPKGTIVKNHGYYTATKTIKWLYVQFTYKGITYTGFASAKRLTRADTTKTAISKKYFKRYTGNSGSIVDSLKAIGVNSSFAYRTKIANANGIKLYSSTASQNIKLLNLLKQGKLIVP
jgi:hypothetical protein